MWRLRRTVTGGLLLLVMLAGAAVVAPGAASADMATAAASLPLSIAQPLMTDLPGRGAWPLSSGLADALVLAAVGAALLMTGSVVRRVT